MIICLLIISLTRETRDYLQMSDEKGGADVAYVLHVHDSYKREGGGKTSSGGKCVRKALTVCFLRNTPLLLPLLSDKGVNLYHVILVGI